MWIIIIIVIIVGAIIVSVDNNSKRAARQETQQNFIEKNNIKVDIIYSYENMIDNVIIKYIVDINSRKIYIDNNMNAFTTISFDEIIGCEIIVDDQIAGGVGRSIIGGIIAGGVGAIVGAITAKKHIMSYKVKLYFNDISNSQIDINLIKSKTALNDERYIKAQKFSEDVSANIKAIIYKNEHEENNTKVSLYKVVIPINNFNDKLEAIKKVREAANYSLADAKDFLEQLLLFEQENLTEERANDLVRLFNNVGIAAYKTNM